MSTDPRLFVDAPLSEGAALILERDQAHYLVSVMRRQPGDGVRVFNGRAGEWRAVLASAGKREARLELAERLREQAVPPPLTLYFAPVKKARTDFIVEKATELGARAIIPVLTRRTQAERVRTDRLSALAREAAEQTERLDVPVIGEPVRLESLLDAWPPDQRLIFCDETGGAPMLEALLAVRDEQRFRVSADGQFIEAEVIAEALHHPTPTLPSRGGSGSAPDEAYGADRSIGRATASGNGQSAGKSEAADTALPPPPGEGRGGGRSGPDVPPASDDSEQRNTEKTQHWAILIGPEGGFAPEERERLRGLPGVVPVSLGPRILRADTAAAAALALWQAVMGDWG
ncbi:MAG: 16S rRNA (uracil(1498)-N(3))-methyltransferase [Oceanicaulis sp.]|nr:16S rRNA (uracil(1498)-N(3))-methyltransferase [Oceanicaulis sp.]